CRRSVSEHLAAASRAVAALDLSPAERVGSRPGGRANAARRVEHVGGLSRPRGGALRPASVWRPGPDGLRRRRRRGEQAHCVGFDRVTTTASGVRRVAIVTGGTRGIGLGIARALAGDGWDLALCGVRAEDAVRGALDGLQSAGAGVFYQPLDIA